MKYDVAVIGAGVAGLVCSLKLATKGKKVILIEKQPVAGGFATSFIRKGFKFESSLHCVDGIDSTGEIRGFLEELGVDKRVDFIKLKSFSRIIYPEHDFIADFNFEHYKGYLKNEFPGQIRNIDRLFFEIDRFYRQFDKFCNSKIPLWIKISLAIFIYPAVCTMSNISVEQFIDKYIDDDKLKGIICDIWRFIGLPPSRLSAFYFLLVFRGYSYASTAYIKGGFSELFKVMVDMIKDNGSEVRFNTTVKKIITKNKAVKAIVLDNQEEIEAKTIVSNANAIDTLTVLLDDEIIREQYKNSLSSYEKSVSAFQVYLGLKVPAKDLGMNEFMFSINTAYNHDDNYNYCINGDYGRCPLAVVDHSRIDPSLAPQGKGILSIMLLDSYLNWRDLNKEDYQNKKAETANKLISQVAKYLPALYENIEVMEIATPLTMARFGMSPEGAIYGFAQTVKQSGIMRIGQKTKIKGLFLAGAWTQPGAGAHGCFISGMDAANLILSGCRQY